MSFDYRAFELRPGGAPVDAAKLQMIRAHYPRLRAQAAALGLPIGEDLPPMGIDTFPAHQASKLVLAKAPGRARDFIRAAFVAHHVEHRRLSDPAVLRELVAETGLDPALLDEALASGAYRDAVRADLDQARTRGFHGVPQLIMNGHVLPPGMHPVATLLDAARQIAAMEARRGG